MKKLFVVAVIGMAVTQTAHAGLKERVLQMVGRTAEAKPQAVVKKTEYRPNIKVREEQIADIIFKEGSQMSEAALQNFLLNSSRGLHKPKVVFEKDIGEGWIVLKTEERDGWKNIVIETKDIDYRELGRFEPHGSAITDVDQKANFIQTVIPMTSVERYSYEEMDELSRGVSKQVVTMIRKLEQDYIKKQLASARNNSVVLSRRNLPISTKDIEIGQRLNSVDPKILERRPAPSTVVVGSKVREILDGARTRVRKPAKPEVTHSEETRKLLEVDAKVLNRRPAPSTSSYGDNARRALERATVKESRSAR